MDRSSYYCEGSSILSHYSQRIGLTDEFINILMQLPQADLAKLGAHGEEYPEQSLDEIEIDKEEFIVILTQTLSFLRDLQSEYYQQYLELPNCFWQLAHSIYYWTKYYQLNDLRIAESYKQIILFSLADPASLKLHEICLLQYELKEWAEYLILNEGREQECAAVIDLFSDRRPYYGSDVYQNMSHEVVSVDLSMLLYHLHGLNTDVSTNIFVQGPGIEEDSLQNFIAMWTSRPERLWMREECFKQVRVVLQSKVGFTQIQTWMMLDYNETGCALYHKGERPDLIEPGQDIELCIKVKDTTVRRRGIVRWVRYSEQGEIKLGVQYYQQEGDTEVLPENYLSLSDVSPYIEYLEQQSQGRLPQFMPGEKRVVVADIAQYRGN